MLLTDGAVEIQNIGGETLGLDGLISLLQALHYPQAPLSIERLHERLLRFSSDIRLEDDLTLLEIRFLGDARGQPPE